MNTKEIAAEYRLSHWAGIVREREESGLSIRAFCAGSGFHENIYYYWQKKLRDATCTELAKIQGNTTSLASTGFAEVKLPVQATFPAATATTQSNLYIESDRVRITAGSEYPIDKLVVLLREVARPC